MMNDVQIKICGITNLHDALISLEAGADLLGFNFYTQSPRFVTTEIVRGIIKQLPKRVTSVGVFVNEDVRVIERTAREAKINVVQLHGDESAEDCRRLMYENLRVMKALRVAENFSPESASEYKVEAVLLDAFNKNLYGGSGETFDWRLARDVSENVKRVFLAGGLNPRNVAEAIRIAKPFGVDVASGVERTAGVKDMQLVREFIAAVRGVEREEFKRETESLMEIKDGRSN